MMNNSASVERIIIAEKDINLKNIGEKILQNQRLKFDAKRCMVIKLTSTAIFILNLLMSAFSPATFALIPGYMRTVMRAGN